MSPARRSISSSLSESRIWPASSATTRASRRPSDPVRLATSARSAGIRCSSKVRSQATILVSTVSTNVPSRSKIHAAGGTRLIAVAVSDYGWSRRAKRKGKHPLWKRVRHRLDSLQPGLLGRILLDQMPHVGATGCDLEQSQEGGCCRGGCHHDEERRSKHHRDRRHSQRTGAH